MASGSLCAPRRPLAAFLALALMGAPAAALAPLPPCEGVIEANMMVGGIQPLGGWGHPGGVTVESCRIAMDPQGGTYVPRPAPLPQLARFDGARVTVCATGAFLAIPGRAPDEVALALAATEFLRGPLAAGRAVGIGPLREAARALYPGVIELRDTEQTCACQALFDHLRPAGMTRFQDRADIDF